MMRAKFRVSEVNKRSDIHVGVTMHPVVDAPYDAEGLSDDNTYAKWTPSGILSLSITNPTLFDKFEVGQKFYADFTLAER